MKQIRAVVSRLPDKFAENVCLHPDKREQNDRDLRPASSSQFKVLSLSFPQKQSDYIFKMMVKEDECLISLLENQRSLSGGSSSLFWSACFRLYLSRANVQAGCLPRRRLEL